MLQRVQLCKLLCVFVARCDRIARLRGVYELFRPQRHPVDEIVNLYGLPFDLGILRFSGCRRWRLGETNDTGWSRGQCRYSKLAPDWGEFYELVGHDPLRDLPDDWHEMAALDGTERHFLFYLRDETFECLAVDWSFAPHEKNALITRLAGTEGP